MWLHMLEQGQFQDTNLGFLFCNRTPNWSKIIDYLCTDSPPTIIRNVSIHFRKYGPDVFMWHQTLEQRPFKKTNVWCFPWNISVEILILCVPIVCLLYNWNISTLVSNYGLNCFWVTALALHTSTVKLKLVKLEIVRQTEGTSCLSVESKRRFVWPRLWTDASISTEVVLPSCVVTRYVRSWWDCLSHRRVFIIAAMQGPVVNE